MGLHTGEPELTAEGYVGMDVHRGARIAAVGHGGQVLAPTDAHALDGLRLRDLGIQRLKDVGEARIYQLGDGDFPPLKTLYQTNLPTPAHPLIGRKKELLDVMRLLAVERVRVVTLTGPGGTGKTRFSVAVASEVTDAFADGTWFVDLSAVREPKTRPADDRRDARRPGRSPRAPSATGRCSAVLDNLEQVVEAADGLARLMSGCPNLHALATSARRSASPSSRSTR